MTDQLGSAGQARLAAWRRYLAAGVAALGSHLVGQRLGHLGSLLGLLQVVLGLPEAAEVDVELLLLQMNRSVRSQLTDWLPAAGVSLTASSACRL